jgi:hypothetical protein
MQHGIMFVDGTSVMAWKYRFVHAIIDGGTQNIAMPTSPWQLYIFTQKKKKILKQQAAVCAWL